MRVLTLAVAALVASGCCRSRESGHRPHAASTAPDASAHGEAPRPRKKKARGKKLSPPTPAPVEPTNAGDDCGSVEVDGARVPIDCHDQDDALSTKAGEPVVSRKELEPREGWAGAAPLPEEVDHRADGTEGPVRSQGKVGSCTAFSLAAAVDHALARQGAKEPVSAMHLWARYHMPNGARAMDANLARPLARESDWPYDVKSACMWLSSSKCKGCDFGSEHVDCKQPVDTSRIEAADAQPYARITHQTRLVSPSVDDLRKVLAKGQDVWIGMRIDAAAFKAKMGEDHVVHAYEPKTAKGGHAMVLAGYRTQADGTYFLIHNSWGPRWGDGGYAWLHERGLRHLRSASIVEAGPAVVNGPDPQPAVVVAPAKACPGAQLPDVVTGACGPACPDRSPRFRGACPSSTGCGEGEIAIGGACVVAAPSAKGTAGNGVVFDCRPGGCVYTLPKGTHGCADEACMHACPTPRFVLVHGPSGLFCSE